MDKRVPVTLLAAMDSYMFGQPRRVRSSAPVKRKANAEKKQKRKATQSSKRKNR